MNSKIVFSTKWFNVIEKYNAELSTLDGDLSALKITKKDAKALIKKYDKQIAYIKNNREYQRCIENRDGFPCDPNALYCVDRAEFFILTKNNKKIGKM